MPGIKPFDLCRSGGWPYTQAVSLHTAIARLGVLALFGAGLALGDSAGLDASPCSMAAGEADYERFAAERLAFWQQRLQLGEWKITLTLTPRSALKPKTLGGIHWDKRKKTAEIAVMAASDYHMACAEMLRDMEFTIVHELVHLELASLPKSEASRSTEEFAVNRLTQALLQLHRGE